LFGARHSCRFAGTIAQIKQFCTTNTTLSYYLDAFYRRRIQLKKLYTADTAGRYVYNRLRMAYSDVFAGYTKPLESLMLNFFFDRSVNPYVLGTAGTCRFCNFFKLKINFNGVADFELGQIRSQSFFFDCVDYVTHDFTSKLLSVRARLSAEDHPKSIIYYHTKMRDSKHFSIQIPRVCLF
jgi:hypothetical protein